MTDSNNCSIFIFKVGSLGDSIVSLPAIRKINDYYGGELHFITNKPSEGVISAWEVYKLTNYFKDCFEFEYSLKSIIRLRKFIQKEKGKRVLFYFADISSFRRNFRNYLFFRILGITVIYGWKECTGDYIERDSSGRLIEVIPEYKRLVNIVDKYLDKKNNHLENTNYITFDSAIVEKISLESSFINNEFIVLGIGGKTDIQKWSIFNYVETLKYLSEEIAVIILGGASDYDDAERVQEQLPQLKIFNLCARTSIQESAYILSKAILYIGNDTGTAHLAGIVKTRCVVITSGRDNLERWTPFGDYHVIIRKRTDCEGCSLSSSEDCEFNVKCMNEIDIKDVKKKLFTALRNEVEHDLQSEII